MSSSSASNSTAAKVQDKAAEITGNPTIVTQVTNLATHSIAYAKGVVGVAGSEPAASSVHDASHNQQGGQTLGSLVNEVRDLSASVIAVTRTVSKNIIAGTSDKVQATAEKATDAAGDVGQSVKESKPVGYVASGREAASNVVDKVLGTIESVIATSAHKIDAATPGSTSNSNTIQGSLQSAVEGTKDSFKAQGESGQSAFANAAGDAYNKISDVASRVDGKTGATGYAKTAAGAVGRQGDIATDKLKQK